ncbi:MAG TPA: outer membrane beta-barrel protein [Gemmataceae bacterium]|nr:outer membrane beta-barrel protein [Gemmataceae bacterium]
MGPSLLLMTALAVGQTAPPEEPKPALPPPDRWPLMLALQGTYPGWLLDGNNLKLYGWVDSAFTASSDRHEQLPMGFNYRANEYHVQQAWIRFERPVDQTAATPTFGFRTDTFAGIDYRFTIARGLFDRQLTANDGEPNTYGVDPVQFYAEAYFPQIGRGLDVKLGRFFAQFGYESIDTTQCPFVSRSYNFIYDPFTHTGLLTTLKLTDEWSVQNGVVTGCDVFFGPAVNPCYVGSVKWAPPTGRDSVLFSTILGSGRFDQKDSFHNPEIFDVVYTHKFSDRFSYVLDALYGLTWNVPEIGFANWWATDHYLSYILTPRLTANGRLEFFDDVQGQRTGFPGLYIAPTAGVTFKPNKYIALRPEVRYDYNTESRPFEGKHDVFTAVMDLLVRW